MVSVISAGLPISVQDLGRTGYRSAGVPSSGVMDVYSATLANRLLNNHENDAVLEITFGGCRLRFESDCTICITGADFSAEINDKEVALNTRLPLQKDSVLSFGRKVYGARTYVAITQGFQTQVVLGSRSLCPGVTPESLIKKGTVLPIAAHHKKLDKALVSVKINQDHFRSEGVDCYKGPEFELLSEAQRNQLVNATFTISPDNNRMGYRLEELVENSLHSLLTSAVLPGTVQLTPSGKLIVLMRDCQVTGGYPRVLQVAEEAISRLGQKTTSDSVRFVIQKVADDDLLPA